MNFLTFDDGPGPSTAALLDVLAARGVRGTFFLLGERVERRREIAVRIAREGHVLGNHTYSHTRDAGQLAEEIARTDALLAALDREAGRPPGGYPVRLPYGAAPDDPRLAVLAALGRPHVGWTADFADWLPSDPVDLARRMRAHVDDCRVRGIDAVIDLHDGSRRDEPRDATVAAVARLIDELGSAAFS